VAGWVASGAADVVLLPLNGLMSIASKVIIPASRHKCLRIIIISPFEINLRSANNYDIEHFYPIQIEALP
jgi:hypothetical protein